jgi:signal peptidase I
MAETPGLSKPRRVWREWRGFLLFVAIMLLFRSAIADWNQVPTGSMIPSIYVGDRIIVDKLAYDLRLPFTLQRIASWSEPQRGDVVTFNSPEDQRLLVKRIIGLPGDEVSLSNNVLTVNGERASYEPIAVEELAGIPITQTSRNRFMRESVLGDERLIMLREGHYASRASNFGPVSVPADRYLVLGDNRDNSRDSRFIGFIDRHLILGRAESVAFSLDYDNYYRPRPDRFFTDLP